MFHVSDILFTLPLVLIHTYIHTYIPYNIMLYVDAKEYKINKYTSIENKTRHDTIVY